MYKPIHKPKQLETLKQNNVYKRCNKRFRISCSWSGKP